MEELSFFVLLLFLGGAPIEPQRFDCLFFDLAGKTQKVVFLLQDVEHLLLVDQKYVSQTLKHFSVQQKNVFLQSLYEEIDERRRVLLNRNKDFQQQVLVHFRRKTLQSPLLHSPLNLAQNVHEVLLLALKRLFKDELNHFLQKVVSCEASLANHHQGGKLHVLDLVFVFEGRSPSRLFAVFVNQLLVVDMGKEALGFLLRDLSLPFFDEMLIVNLPEISPVLEFLQIAERDRCLVVDVCEDPSKELSEQGIFDLLLQVLSNVQSTGEVSKCEVEEGKQEEGEEEIENQILEDLGVNIQ